MTDHDVVIYNGPERRTRPSITAEQVDALVERVAKRAAELAAEQAAEKAAELVKADFYKTVGKSVVDKVLWLVGIAAVAGYLYAKDKGIIK